MPLGRQDRKSSAHCKMFSMMLDMTRVSSDRKHLQVFDNGQLDYMKSFERALDQVSQNYSDTKGRKQNFALQLNYGF